MAEPVPIGSRNKDRRRFPRSAVLWCGELVADARAIECVILDMSANGVKLQLSEPLVATDRRVIVRIPRFGDFHGEVMWRDENRLGVRLNAEPGRIAELIQAILPKTAAGE